MKNGFVRGVLVGTAVAVASRYILNPRYREKAREVIEEGGQVLRGAEDQIVSTGNWIEKGRQLFQMEDRSTAESMEGKVPEDITDRVAVLEKRLEELELKGV